MADSSLLPIVVGGIFSVATAAAAAAAARWRGRREANVEIAKSVSEAAQRSVATLSQVVDQLERENARLRDLAGTSTFRLPGQTGDGGLFS